MSLETLRFVYKAREIDSKKNFHGNFPFEQLQNLRSISLDCTIPFSENSREHLVKSLSQVESLVCLKIEGELFGGLKKERACALIEDLRLKKELESASFRWREIWFFRWANVNMKKANGEMVVSSEYERWK